MAGSLIRKIGFFCKHCGQFFAMIGSKHRDQVYDEQGWGISATHTCPNCQLEAEYLSSEGTMASEEDLKSLGLSKPKQD